MKKHVKIYSMALSAVFLFIIAIKAQGDEVISEILAINNSIIRDEDGDYSDWIEIYNPDTTQVNLKGWFLTDDNDDYSKWVFPDTTIGPKGFMVVFASGKDTIKENGNIHTNFKLSGSGDFLALVKPGGTQFTTVFLP